MKLSWMCQFEDCEGKREGNLPYCAEHNAHFRREARKDKKPKASVRPMQKSYVRKVSEKRQGQLDEYMEGHEEYLMLHPLCEACGDPAEQVHHRNGRFGERLNDQTYWMAICKECHREIHANPEWARKQGYLILRSV